MIGRNCKNCGHEITSDGKHHIWKGKGEFLKIRRKRCWCGCSKPEWTKDVEKDCKHNYTWREAGYFKCTKCGKKKPRRSDE